MLDGLKEVNIPSGHHHTHLILQESLCNKGNQLVKAYVNGSHGEGQVLALAGSRTWQLKLHGFGFPALEGFKKGVKEFL